MVQRNIINIPVDFPYEPYAMQLSIMTRVVNALNNKQNCLLESPTGTGKTMALLCSSLAWVQNEQIRVSKLMKEEGGEEILLVPKIFYGTRTHKQIGQVVREMSRSAYNLKPMTILSSRKQSCVNHQVLNRPDINQACQEVCKKGDCAFKVKVTKIPNETWDIESMKLNLRKKLICPFYQSRLWSEQATIVFCPYNYLLNPSIRKSMNIDINNSIVILDEGHNIEDICRNSASLEMSLENLSDYKVECKSLLETPEVSCHAEILIKLINSLTSFIKALSSELVLFNEEILHKTWTSFEAILQMKKHNIDLDSVILYKTCISYLNDLIKNQEKNEFVKNLPTIQTSILKELNVCLTILGYILKESKDCLSDFRIVVTTNGIYNDIFKDSDYSQEERNTVLNLQPRKRKITKDDTNFILNILCMNPAIVFKDIEEMAHSVILASGTLAPLSSFQRELSSNFSSTLEAGHVVKLSQTLVASVSCGPRGIRLNGTYKNVETYAFQDELGGLLLSCCKTVPHGVLCFVSSFHMIDKLFKRWQDTEIVGEIKKHKTIVIEPRNSVEMDECMKTYYSCIEKGVIMLAVYRGKASEGMDFSDDAARLVIAVGIPFPSFTDFKVNLKKEYNDNKYKLMKEKTEFLSGKEWYSIQAFRALNQAIGRCIRHKDDWGAMILVDERFENEYYSKGLCKWIKMRKKHFNIWPEFLSHLIFI